MVQRVTRARAPYGTETAMNVNLKYRIHHLTNKFEQYESLGHKRRDNLQCIRDVGHEPGFRPES